MSTSAKAKTGKDQPSLINELKKATAGLLFQSESDYPVKPFFMKGNGQKAIKASDIVKDKRPIKQVGFEEFFTVATKEEDWYGPDEQKTVKQFQDLVKILKGNLSDIKIYKSGKVEMDVYVVGKTSDGDFAGISTKVVET